MARKKIVRRRRKVAAKSVGLAAAETVTFVKFKIDKIRQEDVVRAGGGTAEEED